MDDAARPSHLSCSPSTEEQSMGSVGVTPLLRQEASLRDQDPPITDRLAKLPEASGQSPLSRPAGNAWTVMYPKLKAGAELSGFSLKANGTRPWAVQGTCCGLERNWNQL